LFDQRRLSPRPKDYLRIIVNHSASLNGNHITVLKKLKKIDLVGDFEILAPLSYGDESVKRIVADFGRNNFGNKFTALLQRMPMNDYYDRLNEMSIAIFGNRRQEGAGNVFFLLKAGVKVFLRNDNNMIHWLRSNGFIVFSFEDDLISMQQLEPLTPDQALKNLTSYYNLFHILQEMIIMEKLII
jgi:hypothetical protein